MFSLAILLNLSAITRASEDQMPIGGNDNSRNLVAMQTEDQHSQEELLELLAVLDEETEIATKTKMNSDYVPGMVTVLHGDQLEALGFRTAGEALSLVPGIQVARLTFGEPSVKVRGIAFPFNAGNIKVMLNSIPLSRESSGINSSVLLTPVEQIDRIEVIRGPGSIIYGDFAMSGVVNVFTKDSGGRFFAKGGDDESATGGGHYSYRDEEQSFGIGLNLSYSDDGESATIHDQNKNPDEGRMTGVFHLDYKDFSFKAEGVKRDLEHKVRFPRPFGPARVDRTEESLALEGRQKFSLAADAELEAYLSYLSNEQDIPEPDRYFLGDRIETGVDLNWAPWVNHQLYFNLSSTFSEIEEASERSPHFGPGSVNNINRRNYSISLQDEVTLGKRFALTLGLRYDEYDDIGDIATPRIAGVYRLGEHHVLKAQYSEGFRPPTFWELYATGQADINTDFEVIETAEFAYIYRRPGMVGRVTLYHSKIDSGIVIPQEDVPDWTVVMESQGVEVEWEQQIGANFRWLANISYNDTADTRWARDGTSEDSPGIADWLGNLAIFYQPHPKYMLTSRLLLVGARSAPEEPVDGYEAVDFTLSRMDLLKDGLTLRAGVKNLFNNTVSYTTQRPNGLGEDEFIGRTWWLQLSYDF